MNSRKIIALVDYKYRFGSKHFDKPYRSGMDKNLIEKYFNQEGYSVDFKYFNEIDFNDIGKYKATNIIYTSSEDIGYHYKSYIEDIVMALEIEGANIIPRGAFIRANNNKVFMESLRSIILNDKALNTQHFGSLKDLILRIDSLSYPLVLKTAEGATGTGVFLVKNKKELVNKVKKLRDYNYFLEDIKDHFRTFVHKGYQKESIYRNKFIIQKFIPNLKNDWKVLIYGKKYFVLNRGVRENDFRASGSNMHYKTDINAGIPDGMLDYAELIFKKFQIPHVSLDIMFNGNDFFLIEFQAVYFGNATINMSENYFIKTDQKWEVVKINIDLEEIYTSSVISFLEK